MTDATSGFLGLEVEESKARLCGRSGVPVLGEFSLWTPPTNRNSSSPQSPPPRHLPTAFLGRSALSGASQQAFLLPPPTPGAAMGAQLDVVPREEGLLVQPNPPSQEQETIKEDGKPAMGSLDLIVKWIWSAARSGELPGFEPRRLGSVVPVTLRISQLRV